MRLPCRTVLHSYVTYPVSAAIVEYVVLGRSRGCEGSWNQCHQITQELPFACLDQPITELVHSSIRTTCSNLLQMNQSYLWPRLSEVCLGARWACEQARCTASKEAGYQPSHWKESGSVQFSSIWDLTELSLTALLCKQMWKTHINSNRITRYCELGCETTKTWVKAHILVFCTQVMFPMLDCKSAF